MKSIEFPLVGETLYFEVLDNGLEVYLIQKKDFNKTYATFSTKYGSLDRTFIPRGKSEYVSVLDGIAHFLEHKMFEMEDGDAFFKLSSMGANANAFTSYSKTTYLFSATNNLIPAVSYLLDFVQTPYFPLESVEKEKGIIVQELKMYEDYPSFASQTGVLKNMYKEHPIRIDIVGTEDSVNAITPDLLKECYDTFYHPANMQLFVIGNFDVEEMFEAIRKNQSAKTFSPVEEIKRQPITEDSKVISAYQEKRMAINTPVLSLGIKFPFVKRDSSSQLRFELSLMVFLVLLFGESSDNYENLMNKGYINEAFSINGNHEPGIDFVMADAETNYPKELKEELTKILTSLDSFTIKDDDFTRVKNAIAGSFISLFNSLEAISNYFTRYSFMGMNFFDVPSTIMSLTIDDLLALKPYFKKESISTFVILPE